MERRIVTRSVAEIREAGDGSKRIGGYAAVYYDGTAATEYELWPEGPVERILPGAFDKAITGDDVRALWNHDASALLGRKSAGSLRLSSDNVGLRYEIDLPDTTVGRDVYELVKRGDVTQSSFAFEVLSEEWKKLAGVRVRELSSLKLFDVSPVTYPAYTGTSVGMRSESGIEEARKAFAAAEAADAARACADIARARAVAACTDTV